MKKMKNYLLVMMLLALGMMVSVGSTFADGHGSIVDVAAENGNFTTLLAAAEAAGLAEMLDANGPFTVFAPTDAAFASLPEGTVESLLEDPTGALRQILLYHIVQGEVSAADVVTLDMAQTALGKYVGIEVMDGGVVLNGGANVVMTDIQTENGIIHVIDAILLPPAAWGTMETGTAIGHADMGDDMGGDDMDGGMDDGNMDTDEPMVDGSAASQLLDNMQKLRFIIEQMGGVLDRSYRGDTNLCAEYLGYYNGLEMAPMMEGLSPELDAYYSVYQAAIAKVIDTNAGIKEACENDNKIPQGFNRDVARIGINEALDMLIPVVEIAAVVFDSLPDTMPSMPMDDADDSDDADMPMDDEEKEGDMDMPMDDMPAQPKDDMPMDEMPNEDTPAGMDPIDTDGDGELSNAEIDAAAEAYIERLEAYLEGGPLPFNGYDLYADMFQSSNGMLVTALFAGSEDCEFFSIFLLMALLTPEYKDVPAEWAGIYDNYRNSLENFAVLSQPIIESCESTGSYSLTDEQFSELLIQMFMVLDQLQVSIEGALDMLNLSAPYARETIEAVDIILADLQ